MAIYHYTTGEHTPPPPSTYPPSLSTAITVFASIVLPFITVTVLSLLLSTIILALSFPLLVFFSPILLVANSIIFTSVAGFGLSGAAGWAGVWCLRWGFRNHLPANWVGDGAPIYVDYVRRKEMMTESRQRVEDEKMGFGGGGCSYRRVVVHPSVEVESKKQTSD